MKKLTVIFAVCMAVIFFTKSLGQAPQLTESKVFFIDKYMHCLIGVTHKIPKASPENQAKSVIEILSRTQKDDSGFITYISNPDEIGIKVKGEIAYIDLAGKLAETIPSDRENQKLFVYQITNSLCSLSSIKYVKLTVDGKNYGEIFGFFKDKEIFSADYDI